MYKMHGIVCVLLVSLLHIPVYFGSGNICSYHRRQPVCCRGWRNKIGAPCTVAVCAGNCGDRGECIKPNVCRCGDGRTRFSCTEEEDVMQQDQAYLSCPDDCNRQGICENDKCICDHGFRGISCEERLKSACFTKLKRGLCINPMQHPTSRYGNQTTMLTKEECCNSFGVAWGQPCQACVTTYCGRGYHRLDGVCRDINECETSGVCSRGQCVNHDGSYTCKCPLGTKYDKELLDCVYEKRQTCERNPKLCSGGKCLNLPDGDYECTCEPGYQLASDRKSCSHQTKVEFNICTLYQTSVCKNGHCIPRGSTYECACNEGFEPSQDRKTCQYKIDICSVHRGYLCTNGQCIPNGRDYYCQCNPGFVASHDQRRCLSQCEQFGTGICTNGQCISLPNGDFECQCDFGYQNSPDRKQCIPLMEEENEYRPSIYTKKQTSYKHMAEIKPIVHDKSMDVIYARVQHDSNPGRAVNPIPMSMTSRYQSRPSYYSRKYSNPIQPPCSRPEIVAACHGGICLNLGGEAYECECGSGYQNIQNKRMCLPHSGSDSKNIWLNDASANGTIGTIPVSSVRQDTLTISVSGSRPTFYNSPKAVPPPPRPYTTIRSRRPVIRHGHGTSPCDRKEIARQCYGGICLNLGGQAYKCECFEGYKPIPSGKGCVKIGEVPIENGWQSEDSGLRAKEPISNYFIFQKSNPDPWSNYGYDPKLRQKRSVLRPCDQEHIRKLCQGGSCLNVEGKFHQCECLPGYQTSPDGQSCTEENENYLENHAHCPFCSHGCIRTSNSKDVICKCGQDDKFLPVGKTGICTDSTTIVSGYIEKQEEQPMVHQLVLQISRNFNLNIAKSNSWIQLLQEHILIVDQRLETVLWTECKAIVKEQSLRCPLVFASEIDE